MISLFSIKPYPLLKKNRSISVLLSGIICFFCSVVNPLLAVETERQASLPEELIEMFDSVQTGHIQTDSLLFEIKNQIPNLPNEEKIMAFEELARYYFNHEQNDSSLICFLKASSIAKKIENTYLQAKFTMWQSVVLEILTQYDKSLQTALEAEILANKTDSLLLIEKINISLGNIYYSMGIYEKALNHYFIAQKLAEKNNSTRNIASCYNNIANIYQEIEKIPKALEYYYKAYDYGKRENLIWVRGISSNNIGNLYLESKEYDSALTYFYESYEILKELDSRYYMGITLYNIGTTYMEQNSLDTALNYLKLSLTNAENAGDRLGIADGHLKLGEIFLKMNNPGKAKTYLDSGNKLAMEIGSFKQLEKACMLLSNYYSETGMIDSAFAMTKKQLALKDSINQQEGRERIARLENKYHEEQRAEEIDNLKLQKEHSKNILIIIGCGFLIIMIITLIYLRASQKRIIELSSLNKQIDEQKNLLEVRNKELTESQNELRKINLGKDTFLTLISHDLKNPVSAVRGIIDLLFKKGDELDEEERNNFLKGAFEGIERISLLLNNILYWVRSQTNGIQTNFIMLNLSRKVNENISLYEVPAREKNIQIINNIPKNIEILADNNIFDTILRNLLSNSIKFSHKNGKITFTAINQTDDVVFIMSDEGIGMSKEKLKKVMDRKQNFTSYGTNKESGTGLGVSLSIDFVKRLNGSISIESEPGKGTIFTLVLPKKS